MAFSGTGWSVLAFCFDCLQVWEESLVTFTCLVYRICWIMPSVSCLGTAIEGQGLRVKREHGSKHALIIV